MITLPGSIKDRDKQIRGFYTGGLQPLFTEFF